MIAVFQQTEVVILSDQRLPALADYSPVFPNVSGHPGRKGYARALGQRLYAHGDSVLEQAVVGVKEDDEGSKRFGRSPRLRAAATPRFD